MLHITNGDSAAGTLRQAGVPGDVLSWKDVLHEGPVPQGLSLAELGTVRARFIAEAGWAPFDEVHRGFSERDAALEQSRSQDEVVLWFEHDLYDQLQLLQLLDWFADHDPGPARLSLVCDAEYVGCDTPERLRERFPGRQPVSAEQRELARRAWAAFRAPEPTGVASLLDQDTSALPFLRGALLRLLQQLPSTFNGLSRSESQALEAVAAGESRLGRVYLVSHYQREEAIFLGDCVFARYVEGLGRAREPLLVRTDGQPLTAPALVADVRQFWDGEVRLTDFGREVVAGRGDHVRVNGIDRWLGGVHLNGPEARWRWDGAAGRLHENAA
jgi:hypothetical protein